LKHLRSLLKKTVNVASETAIDMPYKKREATGCSGMGEGGLNGSKCSVKRANLAITGESMTRNDRLGNEPVDLKVHHIDPPMLIEP